MLTQISSGTETTRENEALQCSRFAVPEGTEECYIAVTSSSSTASLKQTLEEMVVEYDACLAENGLSENTLAFTRIYFSDIANQLAEVSGSPLFGRVSAGAVSCVEQLPLSGGLLAMLCYHIKPVDGFLHKAVLNHSVDHRRTGALIKGVHYSMYWSTNFGGTGAVDSGKQTTELFSALSAKLQAQNMTLRNNTVRTWIYVRDIDNNYSGMVEARTPFFAQLGLTDKTRYLASTGIEGKAGSANALVTMDALSIGGLTEDNFVRIEALENMPPTISYNVTFERGLRIRFGDRSHLYISGTASIDRNGKVMHEGDVEAQTHRAIDNIEALLAGQGGTLHDMAYFVLYLRNPNHFAVVREIIKERVSSGIPVVAVQGAVCRPSWLVELEGVAIIPDSNDFAPFL